MRFRDLLDPQRAPSALMKLALGLVVLSLVLQFVCCFLRQASPLTGLTLLCVFLFVSPLAYVIRQWRRGGRPPRVGRRGAERTPLLPQHEEGE